MSDVVINKDKLDILANAISGRSGQSLPLTLDQMVTAVDSIPEGKESVLTHKYITENGTYPAYLDGVDGYLSVNVDVLSGGEYTRTEIVPLQTFTPGSNRQAVVTGTSAGYVDGAFYIVTYDGVEWLTTCETLWTNNYTIGEVGYFFGQQDDIVYPFGSIWMPTDDTDYTIALNNTNQHSIKIERLEFTDEGTVLGTKSITTNGTYNASTDDLDGYSSVSVNVPSSESTFVVTLSWNSSTSKWESDKTYAQILAAFDAEKTIVVNCADSPATVVADGYYVTSNDTFVYWVRELRNDGVTDNIHEREYVFSQTGLTLESSALYCNTHGATLNNANQLLNGVTAYSHGTMYVGNIPNMTLPTAASSTSSGTSKATISRSTSNQYLNIPTGYNGTAQYYTISATSNMTLPTAASSTSSGTAKATVTPSTSNQYINIPTGYNGTAQYYTVSAMTSMTLPTAASTTSSGTAKATITPGATAQYLNIPTGYNATAQYYTIAASGGGGGGIGTLLNTTSLGTVSTTSTQAGSLNISLSVTGVNDYDLLIVESSVNTVTNNRHTCTVGLIFLTAGTTVGTKNGAGVATMKLNMKASSTGTTTTSQSTTAYGIYPNSCTVSNGTATIPMYRRYNSTSTGTINGTYTARVYGVNLYTLIGG